MSDKEVTELEKKMQEALTFKNSGNNAFAGKNFKVAAEKFTQAIELDTKNHALYSNRSAAYMKMKMFKEALADGEMCLKLKPDWAKGFSRTGAALYSLGEYEKSVTIYAQGLAKDPADALLTKGLAASQEQLRKKNKLPEDDTKDGLEEEEHVIGIDLGTTYSCVGVWEKNQVTIIANTDGNKTIPSYVHFSKEDGSRLVGQSAKNQATREPSNTIYDIKRVIGQRFSDSGVDTDIRRFPFAVVQGDNDKPMVEVTHNNQQKQYAPEQISAMVLGTCKTLAEKYLGTTVNKAVITVPAYFSDSQRNATKAAGVIAGLEVMRIINEPTAAALAYGLDTSGEEKKNDEGTKSVLVFDLGGGTFDVSILVIENGIFTVKATGGDTRLGGEDFDNATIDFILTEAIRGGCPDPRTDNRAMQRLRKACEAAKRALSEANSSEIRVDALMGNHNFKFNLTRQKFEQLQISKFTMCMETVRHVLKDAKMKPAEIDDIVLVGGSTRIPKLQEMLREMFDNKQLCKALNPDEAVAYGAAVQGAILNGKRSSKTDNVLLMDVTPLSLGIETTGRVMSVIIPRNTPIPCVKTQTYTTEHNYQTKVDIPVYEGERMKSDENNLLGEFAITGIESAKRGEPQIDVAFSLDSNGILTVTAKDQKTGSVAKIEIANRSRASNEDIEKMVAEAEQFRMEDQERTKRIESKNEFEALIYEAIEMADSMDDAKLGKILRDAAVKDQDWLDENADSAKLSELNLRKRTLNRRLQNKRP
jgi:heat shock protein 1/8